jgi:hypothetical protein
MRAQASIIISIAYKFAASPDNAKSQTRDVRRKFAIIVAVSIV